MASSSTLPANRVALRRRLLQDIAELQEKPYPNVSLHIDDQNIQSGCLILEVEGYGKMHMTVFFPDDYPLSPPTIQMNSDVRHPNIFSSYICASILNTTEGYTPAYTLKGVAIQMLSFFGSDKIEQSGGGYSISLDRYRDGQQRVINDYSCKKCNFKSSLRASVRGSLADYLTPKARDYIARSESGSDTSSSPGRSPRSRRSKKVSSPSTSTPVVVSRKPLDEANLPDEVLLLICERLDFEDLMAFAQSWPRIGDLIRAFDIIRTRELQCFCLKKGYLETGLGVGVYARGKSIESEFDLLSYEAFHTHRIRRAVFGREFNHWLPLPISYGHWRKVNGQLTGALNGIAIDANVTGDPIQVIYQFMNDIVVKLNQVADITPVLPPSARPYNYFEPVQSSLTHASEKAIESYFHLFHLLMCMATVKPEIVRSATRVLDNFLNGRTSKSDCPNLGQLLVSGLIADTPMDEKLLKAIIKEAITRNVVWMLNDKPDLAYLEPSAYSAYRLQETFNTSKTSYRLLMFLNLFRRTAVGSPRTKTLIQLRDEAFERHGAPPRGAAEGLARSIKTIHQIGNFPDFLTAMGLGKPTKEWFTDFLRNCVRDSMSKGYSRWPINQGQALSLRLRTEPDVELASRVVREHCHLQHRAFFPIAVNGRGGGRGGGRGNGGYGGGRGGRGGRGRGHYH